MTFSFLRALIMTSIFGGALILSDAQAACRKSYSIGYSSDYLPYQYKNAEGIPSGLDIDLTEAIMAEMGCEYSFKLMPSKRAQVLLRRGTLDLMPAASITDERQIYANFSAPYRDENMVMFIRTEDQGKYQFYTLKSAIDSRLRIVAGLGGWYGVEYGEQKEPALLNGALTLNSSTEIRMQQLLDYRADLVVADLFVGYHHAIIAGRLRDVTPLSHILNSDPVHFMLSRKSVSEAEVDQFNLALGRVLKSEKYQRLLAKYRPRMLTPTN